MVERDGRIFISYSYCVRFMRAFAVSRSSKKIFDLNLILNVLLFYVVLNRWDKKTTLFEHNISIEKRRREKKR